MSEPVAVAQCRGVGQPYGATKDLEVEEGLAMSQTDGGAKAPRELPAAATRDWPIEEAVADAYAVTFQGPVGLRGRRVTLAQRDGGTWQALATEACLVDGAWDPAYLETAPARDPACDGQPLVGFDGERTWWAVLTQDAELALVNR